MPFLGGQETLNERIMTMVDSDTNIGVEDSVTGLVEWSLCFQPCCYP